MSDRDAEDSLHAVQWSMPPFFLTCESKKIFTFLFDPMGRPIFFLTEAPSAVNSFLGLPLLALVEALSTFPKRVEAGDGGEACWRQLYKNRSSQKIYSLILFPRE